MNHLKENYVQLRPIKEKELYELTINLSDGYNVSIQDRFYLQEIKKPEQIEYENCDKPIMRHGFCVPIDVYSSSKKQVPFPLTNNCKGAFPLYEISFFLLQ